MDSNGGFHSVEKDGKLYLVYHHPKYSPIPQTLTPTFSPDLPLQPLFLCPAIRCLKEDLHSSDTVPLNSPPESVFPTATDSDDHHVLLNNKEFDAHGGCGVCHGSNFSTDYYFCNNCDEKYHKECVQSPLKIKHPYHPEHYLQLSYHRSFNNECLCCGREARWLVYHCTICRVFMHPICAMKPIPFVIDPPKKHDHPLTLFPRQTSLTCNVCGWLRKTHPTYVCLRCNFVAHNDCMDFPRIIKISRHHHRISYHPSLPSRERSCGVCRQSINGDYGAYTCVTCSDYVVHSICATGKSVWDGKELEGVPEEDDITQDPGPFDVISEGVIRYFLHDHHHLRLEVSILYDENKVCKACALPIYEGNFYSCMECEFILHEKCAKAPRRIQHALHPHPLTLLNSYMDNYNICDACNRRYTGFDYVCSIYEFDLDLDVRCASISEPFDYEGHEHPLFLALLDLEVRPICHVCKRECRKQLNCIKCDFIVCFKCATLPYKARYKHDAHFLTILCGEEVFEKDWCEVCEYNFKDTDTKVVYWCNECCTFFHIECLIGAEQYMIPGREFNIWGERWQILRKCNISRPLCDRCKKRCQGKIFKRGNKIACSLDCSFYL